MPPATQFGRIFPPRTDWLAKAPSEPVLEPDLSIIDAHHHLWHRPDFPYLLPEFLADCATGHKVTASVFLQCHAMYRAAGPEEMRPVGETEFVAGIAALSDSGAYGGTRVAAAIIGFADLEAVGSRIGKMSERDDEAGWDDDAIGGAGLYGDASAPIVGNAGRLLAALYRNLH